MITLLCAEAILWTNQEISTLKTQLEASKYEVIKYCIGIISILLLAIIFSTGKRTIGKLLWCSKDWLSTCREVEIIPFYSTAQVRSSPSMPLVLHCYGFSSEPFFVGKPSMVATSLLSNIYIYIHGIQDAFQQFSLHFLQFILLCRVILALKKDTIQMRQSMQVKSFWCKDELRALSKPA
jgi:hypothetical protein